MSPVERYIEVIGGDQLNARAMPWAYGVSHGLFNCDCLVCWAEGVEVKAVKSRQNVIRLNRRKYLRLKDLGRISKLPAVVIAQWQDGLGLHVVDGLAGSDGGWVRIPVEWFREVG